MQDHNNHSNFNDEIPPMDDYGIHQDRLLEICEKIIEKIHNKYVIDDYTPKTALAGEFKDVSETLKNVWAITQEVLNLDDVIRSAVEAMSDDVTDTFPGEEDDKNDENKDDEQF